MIIKSFEILHVPRDNTRISDQSLSTMCPNPGIQVPWQGSWIKCGVQEVVHAAAARNRDKEPWFAEEAVLRSVSMR